MRRFAAIVLATTLTASAAFAGQNDGAPLSPGKPAGVQEANLAGNGLLLVFGLAIVAGGLALVVSQGSSNTPVASTTATTFTSP